MEEIGIVFDEFGLAYNSATGEMINPADLFDAAEQGNLTDVDGTSLSEEQLANKYIYRIDE